MKASIVGWGRWLVILVAVLIGGCDGEPSTPLRMATDPWPGNEVFHLAKSWGYLDEDRVRLIELVSPTQTSAAFRNRQVDAQSASLDETLMMLRDGLAISVIMVMDFSNGGDAIVARPGIAGLKDLKDRRVGGDNLGPSAYLLSRALELADMPADSITLVPILNDEQKRMFAGGEVEAMVVAEPTLSELLADGANLLFDSRRIPGEIVDLLIVHRDVARAHRKQLRHLVEGWYRAVARLKADRSAAVQIMADRLNMNGPEVEHSLDLLWIPDRAESLRLLTSKSDGLAATAQRMAALLKRRSFLSGPVDTAALFDPGLIAFIFNP